MSESQIYLSVIVTARNDDHGGNLLGRMQAFLNAWFGQVKRHHLSCELIVVEWNPPPDRPPLLDVLKWPADTGGCSVRFIQVPPEIHRRYRHAESLPLYQMIAKNVAIRRARGRFILATNIDIIFSDELIEFLASQGLQPGRMYRMDRHDVAADVPVDATVGEQLEYCRTNLIRVCAREGYFQLSPDGSRVLSEGDIAGRDSGIAFGEGWYAIEQYSENEKFRWVDKEAEVTVRPPSGPPPPLVFDLEPGPGVGRQPFLLQVLDSGGRLMTENLVPARCKLEVALPPAKSASYSFRFRVPAGGHGIPSDPRIMNFRVFSCAWDLSRAPRESTPEVLLDTGDASAQGFGMSISGLQAEGVAVSQWKRALRFYTDAGGPLAAVLAWRTYSVRRKSFTRQVERGQDIVQRGSGISLGAGWYPIEFFRGESFRWVQNDAELIVRTPATPPSHLGLQIEPGPGVGHKPFELLVQDSAGVVVAKAFVEKLRYLELQLPLSPGRTQVFSLSLRGGDLPPSNGDDPRILNFRLFWCGFPGASSEISPGPAEHLGGPLGIDFGRGCPAGDPDSKSRLCHAGAEVILRTADPRVKGLFLEVEPLDGISEFELLVRNWQGILGSYRVSAPNQELHIPLPMRLNRTDVLELGVENYKAGTPLFRLKRWGWSTVGASPSEPPRTSLSSRIMGDPSISTTPPLAETQPVQPVFLHTNTCGDFTLMAREHWFDLRGYPEWDMYSFHIDSVLCYSAHHGGATEEILRDPMRCYHIEHGLGSGWTPEGQTKLFDRLRERGIPWIAYSDLVTWISQMRRFDCTMIFNRDMWGLADCDLPETTPGLGRGNQRRC